MADATPKDALEKRMRQTLGQAEATQHKPIALRLSAEDRKLLEMVKSADLSADRSAFCGVPILPTDQQRSFLSATHPWSGEVHRFFLHLAGRRL